MTISSGHILIVDDDAGFRAYLRALLERAGYATSEAATGDDGVRVCLERQPDAVLLDVNIPGKNGYAVCSELRNRFGDQLGILFVSGARTESFDRVGGLLLGADDYIVKPFDPDELLARVRRFARRRPRAARRSPAPMPDLGLTFREQEVLRLLVRGLRQAEIASELFISPKTVATHIQRILSKLNVNSRAQAVAVAVRRGLVRLDHDEADVATAGNAPAR